MEGSRHEKAAVTIASYLIGFVTAFILYANVIAPSQGSYLVPAVVTNNVAGVVAAVTPVAVDVPVIPAKPETKVTYLDGNLEVTVGDTINLLSFNPDLSNANVEVVDLVQGYHYGEMTYAISEDQKFVFFCERQDKSEPTCSGFVYDVNADRIYSVIKNGTPVSITARSASDTIWTLFGLKIGSHYSANPKAPWVLIADDSTLDLR